MDVEQRARELLAAHLVETKALWGPPLTDQTFDLGLIPPTMQACVRAIIAALTPPEGYERTIRDAARYNYLRDRLLDTSMFNDAGELIYCDERNGPELDALIDSEIDRQQEVPDERG